jgi:hypothetical protein
MANKSSPHGGFITAGTVSHGTLRIQDLLRTLADELLRVMPFKGLALATDARNAADMVDREGDHISTTDDAYAVETLAALFDQLEEIAQREGLTFGAHEGDGSDFGYWTIEGDD